MHKYVNRDEQSMFTVAGGNGGARARRAAGPKSIMNQFTRTAIRKEAVRAVEKWNRLPVRFREEEKPYSSRDS